MAGWQRGGRVPFPPNSRLSACATYYRFAKVSCLSGDLSGLTSARDQRSEAISSRAATSGGDSRARRPALRTPCAGGDPAASGQRQRSDTPSGTAAQNRGPR